MHRPNSHFQGIINVPKPKVEVKWDNDDANPNNNEQETANGDVQEDDVALVRQTTKDIIEMAMLQVQFYSINANN